ncbi:MAG: hemolysin family protein [Alphaproteobacteria bacterium]|nr:hemolysin family protein [Alphaproteobacteria bacterium]MDP6590331.1 hemolysin family protein [Alphaproteobacteria bacterium]MDP6816411.1 hemolysin family protein [Alphaproteobacteria bacterium]
MNDSDKPTSANEAASPDEESRPEPSLVRSVSDWLLRAFARNGDATWQESLEELIEEEEEISEQITPEERDLLMNLLRLGHLNAEDAMVPRPDITAIEERATLNEIVDSIKQSGHSRMPVYRDTLDEVVGMVHIRDVMSFWGGTKKFELSQIIRQVLFVPQSMPVVDLLAKMRTSRLHMAVIVDEYGGTDGLVTIEDLVEEIVGEIEDEHDATPTPTFSISPDGIVEADARTEIEALESHFGVALRDGVLDEDIETVGGLVSRLAGRVPLRHDRVNHPVGLTFEILDADPRRVRRVRVIAAAALGETGET